MLDEQFHKEVSETDIIVNDKNTGASLSTELRVMLLLSANLLIASSENRRWAPGVVMASICPSEPTVEPLRVRPLVALPPH